MPRIASRPHRAAKIGSRVAAGAREAGRVAGDAVGDAIDEAQGRRTGKDLTKQVGELKLLVIGLILLVVLTSGIWVWPYFFARQVVGQAQGLAAQAEHEQRMLAKRQEQERQRAEASNIAARQAQQAQQDAVYQETTRREVAAREQAERTRIRETVGPKLPPLRTLRSEMQSAQGHTGMSAEDSHDVANMLIAVDIAIKACENAIRTGHQDSSIEVNLPADQYRSRLAGLAAKYAWDAPVPEALQGDPVGTTLHRIEQLLAKVEPKLAKVGTRAPAAAVAAVAAAKAAALEARGQAAAEVDIDVLKARLDELRNASDELDLLE